mgnify:CR=1 FL=1
MSIAVFGGFCLNILWESYPSTGKGIYVEAAVAATDGKIAIITNTVSQWFRW